MYVGMYLSIYLYLYLYIKYIYGGVARDNMRPESTNSPHARGAEHLERRRRRRLRRRRRWRRRVRSCGRTRQLQLPVRQLQVFLARKQRVLGTRYPAAKAQSLGATRLIPSGRLAPRGGAGTGAVARAPPVLRLC